MRPYATLRIYPASRQPRYHGLTQIQSYTWGVAYADTYAEVSGIVYALGPGYLALPPLAIYLPPDILFRYRFCASRISHPEITPRQTDDHRRAGRP